VRAVTRQSWKAMTTRNRIARSLRMLLSVAAAGGMVTAVPAGAAEPADPNTGGCHWGGTDPALFNVLYPDENANYWATFEPTHVPGLRYQIVGEFPHSRFMSFNVYNGAPMDHLYDQEIAPDPGSRNPFMLNANRKTRNRSYTIPLIDAPPPADPSERQPGALYTGGGQMGTPAPSPYFVYRVYLPDRGTGRQGGVRVPEIQAIDPQGNVVTKPLETVPCERTRRAVTDPLAGPVQGTIKGSDPTGVSGAHHPRAADPPQWSATTGLTDAYYKRITGEKPPVRGGPMSNEDNTYIAADTSISYGRVLAIRAKAPTNPTTYDGDKRMGSGDLRYWSICQNDQELRYVACLNDERIPVDDDGFFVVAVSGPRDRPANAANWIPWGPESEGRLMFRQQLPSPAFYPVSAKYAEEHEKLTGDDLAGVMGPYLPQSVYCSKARFEQDRCGLGG
jgi:hypothetical protein